jgi:bifunctional UDP-N-acetylglucosamine pyrophosphorylase/glucosamine-1-phosphate N-acetyltransferase
MIRDCTVGEYTTVNASQLNESRVGDHTTVGPFTYVRPKCVIGDHCRVGDFVEVKNSVIGNGTKISHLTYVGDSDVGEKVNFGCGTVTTNYDGNRKFRCTIGDNVFLGCNTNLVAPVTLGDGVYTAAGSTITEDVPADALAIARARQTNKPGWAAAFRKTWKKK